MRVSRLASILAGCLLVVASALPGHTADMVMPEGDVILTVSGAVARTNLDGTAVFDLEMLKELPQTSFTTSTIWTEGKTKFRGVLLADLLEAVQAEGETIHAIALNDYAVDIPTSDAVLDGPILAYEMNGKAMSVREKGPLWVVYPYDQNAQYRTELTYSQSIWQLDRIDIR